MTKSDKINPTGKKYLPKEKINNTPKFSCIKYKKYELFPILVKVLFSSMDNF